MHPIFSHVPAFRSGRLTAAALCAVAAVCATPAAYAQDVFPSKPITVVIPFPPGGINDNVARPALKKMGDLLNVAFVAENRAGASGTIGTGAVARAKPDGYTLLLGAASTMAVVPNMMKAAPYAPMKDFVAVGGLASVPSVLISARKDLYPNYAAVLAAAKQTPDRLTFGSAGAGTSHHVQMTFLNQQSHVSMLHVPYKGSGPAMADLLGGQIDFLMDPLPTTLPQVQGGKVVPIAITSAKRSPLLPNVPTFVELGVKDFVVTTWFGFFAPAGTPPEIVAKLSSTLKEALADPEVVKNMEQRGLDPMYKPSGDMAEYLAKENTLWKRVIAETKMALE
jgi:tripartite-type tricarboxylate transporter receptor subunit TctC